MSVAKQINSLLKASGKLAKTPRTSTLETRIAGGEYIYVLAAARPAQSNGLTDQDGNPVTLSGSDDGGTNEPVVVGCVRVRNLNWYLGEVSNLVVAPDYRGRGVARKLFEMAEAKLKAKGARVVIASDSSDDPDVTADRYGLEVVENAGFTNRATGRDVAVLLKTL